MKVIIPVSVCVAFMLVFAMTQGRGPAPVAVPVKIAQTETATCHVIAQVPVVRAEGSPIDWTAQTPIHQQPGFPQITQDHIDIIGGGGCPAPLPQLDE